MTAQSPSDYFSSFGWRLRQMPGSGSAVAWQIEDGTGATFLPTTEGLSTDDAIWHHWSRLARRYFADIAASDVVLDAVDQGYLSPFTTLAELREREDAYPVLERAAKVAYHPPTSLPADWQAALAMACAGQTLADLEGETWLTRLPERMAARVAAIREARELPPATRPLRHARL